MLSCAFRRPTDRASAAIDRADRQRRATESRHQNATELRNAQLSGVGCKPLLDGGARRGLDYKHQKLNRYEGEMPDYARDVYRVAGEESEGGADQGESQK
jgi:hypothetical protein